MARGPLFFASDFGLSDAYVGIVKAVVWSIAPGTPVIDLAHELPPQDVRRGAYQLFEAAPYLPVGSIVLGVVDPGVGSSRRAVVVEGKRHWWIAPDNGLLSLAFEHDPPRRAYALENPEYRLASPSATFHARDIFGPAAAHLARGVEPARLGPELPLGLLMGLRATIGRGPHGEVLTFDRFGNAITTLQAPLPSGVRRLRIAGRELPIGTHYAEVGFGQPLALVGSANLLEASVREGSAREVLGLEEGTPVELI